MKNGDVGNGDRAVRVIDQIISNGVNSVRDFISDRIERFISSLQKAA